MEGSHERDSARINGSGIERVPDSIVIERALEISVKTDDSVSYSLGVTMRTPGSDTELVLGFLLSEGIIQNIHDVKGLSVGEDIGVVSLAQSSTFDPDVHSRRSTISSSCGVCGRISVDGMLNNPDSVICDDVKINLEIINSCIISMKQHQTLFKFTGGSHATASFTPEGDLERIYEDIGRHNSMDKLVGSYLSDCNLPITDRIVVVSGRASFDLVQKALVAGFPIMVSIGAPSTMAIDMANEHGLTLACFAKSSSISVFSGTSRIKYRQ